MSSLGKREAGGHGGGASGGLRENSGGDFHMRAYKINRSCPCCFFCCPIRRRDNHTQGPASDADV